MLLVTGANGHLGANLIRRLLADGDTVRVLLRPKSDNSSVDGLAVERVFGDLRDRASLLAATQGCAGVYHCAARISTIGGSEQEIFDTNVLGTRNVLQAAAQNGVARVVVSGSLSAVGHRREAPTDETVPFNPFEDHLPYGFSKAAAEHECLKAAADGLDVVIATSCAILGPNDFKPSRMGQLLIDYSRRRLRAYVPGGFEFVSTRDIVEGHLLAMRKGRRGHKYIFSTEFMTMDALMRLYTEVTGQPMPPLRLPPKLMMGLAHISELTQRFSGRRQLLTRAAVRLLDRAQRVDCSKARRELGYRSGSIAQAVHDAYECFVTRGVIERAGVSARSAYVPQSRKTAC
jgi:nucleoside-diphosphate-sugar epimerase